MANPLLASLSFNTLFAEDASGKPTGPGQPPASIFSFHSQPKTLIASAGAVDSPTSIFHGLPLQLRPLTSHASGKSPEASDQKGAENATNPLAADSDISGASRNETRENAVYLTSGDLLNRNAGSRIQTGKQTPRKSSLGQQSQAERHRKTQRGSYSTECKSEEYDEEATDDEHDVSISGSETEDEDALFARHLEWLKPTVQSARTYARLPNVHIEELRLNEADLNTKRMMELMAVGTRSMPLYMHVVQRILRDLRLEQQGKGTRFSYEAFPQRIMSEDWRAEQLAPLLQRLETLESFLARRPKLAIIPNRLAHRILCVAIRRRVTKDGGECIMAS
ncbi:hypothetical protein F5Y18DRAFT_422530 [Xylariaceae sp. FL1019]|nr:hypothetical protein F5Y18DRAFT_422530 [Xylariaceae sp. FL1019]